VSAQLARLTRRLAAIPREVKAAVVPALLTSGDELADMQRHLAPVDSGDLKGSIAVTGPGQSTPPYSLPGGSMVVPENAVAVTAGNTAVRYAHLAEYGAVHAPAHPYFWPAYRLLKARMSRRIKRAISKAVKQGWGT
jgi:HK97 gp10 family phage protein